MPVIALITRMLSAIWTFLVDAAKSEKRRSKAKKEEKVAKTARVQLAKDVNEIRDLVEQLRIGKNLTEMQALITEMKMLLKNQRPEEGRGLRRRRKLVIVGTIESGVGIATSQIIRKTPAGQR